MGGQVADGDEIVYGWDMQHYRRALERLAAFLDGLETPFDPWLVALEMQQIAREALGAKHVEFPPLRRECRIEVDEALEFISGLGIEQPHSTQETIP